jgi:purine-binding chemotaxis protein CheW
MATYSKDYYAVLQVSQHDSLEIIEAAYRRLALTYHPDLNPSPSANGKMQEINEAFSVLKHPQKRAAFDLSYRPAVSSVQYTVRKPTRTQPRSYYKPAPTRAEEKLQVEELHVVFHVGDQTYGIGIQEVETVLLAQNISRHAAFPQFVVGVTKVRGAEVPVIDLRPRLGFERKEIDKDSRIVLVKVQDIRVGLLVDSVENYLRIPINTIKVPAFISQGQDLSFIKGIARVGFNILILLNVINVLTNVEKVSLQDFACEF